MTAEQLWDLHLTGRCELITGVLRHLPFHDCEHGLVAGHLAGLIGEFVHRHEMGLAVAGGTGFVVSRNPDTVLAPDFGYIARENQPKGKVPDGFWNGAPDFAVDVVSSDDEARKRENIWTGTSIKSLWIVKLNRRSVIDYWSPTDVREKSGEDVLS